MCAENATAQCGGSGIVLGAELEAEPEADHPAEGPGQHRGEREAGASPQLGDEAACERAERDGEPGDGAHVTWIGAPPPALEFTVRARCDASSRSFANSSPAAGM